MARRVSIAILVLVAIVGSVAVWQWRTETIDKKTDVLHVAKPSGNAIPAEPSLRPGNNASIAEPSSPSVSAAAEPISSDVGPTVIESLGDGPAKLAEAFEAEVIDFEWAQKAEAELHRRFDLDTDLLASSAEREIQCRSQTCRVQFKYAMNADRFADFSKIANRASGVVRTIVNEREVATGALALHSGAGPGEAPASNIFLFRSGFNQVLVGFKHPGMMDRSEK
jgi:hypothetical protein